MKISILGSTKEKHVLSKEDAILFSGKSAGICYMPDTIDVLFNEEQEKTIKRAERTLISGHHSVFDHPTYNLALEEIPKILRLLEKLKELGFNKFEFNEDEDFTKTIYSVYPSFRRNFNS